MTRRRQPQGFVPFAERTLRVTLTPGQRVLALVAFDGVQPEQLEGRDRELAHEIFGDVDVVPAEARHVLAALCGARAGKSYILGALRLLHLALTVDLSPLAAGEQAYGVIAAPDLRLARQTLRYVTGAVDATPSIRRLVKRRSEDSVTLCRPDGATVTIECLPATRGGSAVRGRTLVGYLLDEACFFRDSNYAVNDDEMFKGGAPRVVRSGQVIIDSTPWAESGLLFEMFRRNHGSPVDALAAHAPTLLLRDDAHTRSLVERERERDPDNALREFDAQPMSAGASDFFDPQAIALCTDEDLPLVLNPQMPEHASAVLGLDTGFRKDPSAGVVVRHEGELYQVAECVEIRPPAGGRLVPSVTIEALLERGKHHRASTLACDQHYVDTVREHAIGFSVREAPGGITGKLEAFTKARRLIHEGKVRIPAGQRRLLAQLRQVVQRPTSGGQLQITIPRRGGAHGDLASAFVLALWASADLEGFSPERLRRMTQTMRELGAFEDSPLAQFERFRFGGGHY